MGKGFSKIFMRKSRSKKQRTLLVASLSNNNGNFTAAALEKEPSNLMPDEKTADDLSRLEITKSSGVTWTSSEIALLGSVIMKDLLKQNEQLNELEGTLTKVSVGLKKALDLLQRGSFICLCLSEKSLNESLGSKFSTVDKAIMASTKQTIFQDTDRLLSDRSPKSNNSTTPEHRSGDFRSSEWRMKETVKSIQTTTKKIEELIRSIDATVALICPLVERAFPEYKQTQLLVKEFVACWQTNQKIRIRTICCFLVGRNDRLLSGFSNHYNSLEQIS